MLIGPKPPGQNKDQLSLFEKTICVSVVGTITVVSTLFAIGWVVEQVTMSDFERCLSKELASYKMCEVEAELAQIQKNLEAVIETD